MTDAETTLFVEVEFSTLLSSKAFLIGKAVNCRGAPILVMADMRGWGLYSSVRGPVSVKEVESKKTEIKALESQLAEVDPKFQDFLLRINNVPDPSVPTGASEADNKVLREVGKKTELAFAAKNHEELGEKLGILDFKTG